MLQDKLEMETSTNGPMATVGVAPTPKYSYNLKPFTKVVETPFLNKNDRY